ncbi:exosortase U [Adhaeretor mobilis]|uniref:exosortase U n=1 Tax=Adhaeretor mobilis TaxID=1930276 RepID=UPI001C54DD46|nr:exosortase U [Adhaeretor mobilis]
MLTAIVLCAAYSPLLSKFFRSLWNRSHYQHFPFVLGAFAWLLWQRTSQAVPSESPNKKLLGWLSGFLFAVAWAMLALAYYVHSPWLAAVSAVTLVAGFLVRSRRVRLIQNAWGIWLLLLLIVPLPTHPDQQLIAVLQLQSSRLSSTLLDWIGISHLMSGNVLRLAGKELFVDEACSGIVSLMSIVACAVIYSVWNNRSLIHMLFLTLAGIGWATLMNVTRICTIAYAFDRWGVDWTAGLPHELLGLAVFLLTFLALVSTDRLLLRCISPIAAPYHELHGTIPKYGRLLIAGWDATLRRFSPRLVEASRAAESQVDYVRLFAENMRLAMLGAVPLVAFAMLGGIQMVYGDWLFDLEKTQAAVGDNAKVLENAATIDAELLPKQCATFNRVSFTLKERESDNVFGKYSQTYEYQDFDKDTMLVSCDYPFSGGWHELAICYQGIGWEQTDRQIVDAPGADENETWGFVEISFTGREGAHAHLVYCQFDEHGQAVAPPTSSFTDYIFQRLLRPSGSVQGKQFFQVQVWTTGAGEVSEEKQEKARELLLDTRERFRRFITQGSASSQLD